jgi:hypothetical protein
MMQVSPSRKTINEERSIEKVRQTPRKSTKQRPISNGRVANPRRRETELHIAKSRNDCGPNSKYFL